jgi:hypothetical protein
MELVPVDERRQGRERRGAGSFSLARAVAVRLIGEVGERDV